MSPVLDYLAANQERFITDLCDYALFPSVSAQPQHAPDLRAAADWLANRARGLGLSTQIHETDGNPIITARTPHVPGAPTYLVYGHYDVQPPEPFELWTSPPFEPRIVGRNVFARGISDNKGQHLAHLNAVEAYLKTGTPLPCNLTFLIEGEEEVGSTQLYAFLPKHKKELACDAVVISDNGIPSLKHPALTYALRGIAALEVRIDGPSRDLHSGLFGGTVENPAMALCQLLGRLRDARGRITIPGFYDDVEKLSAYERKQLNALPFSPNQYRKLTGSPQLFGEHGFTPEEQRQLTTKHIAAADRRFTADPVDPAWTPKATTQLTTTITAVGEKLGYKVLDSECRTQYCARPCAGPTLPTSARDGRSVPRRPRR